ncbi:unnamed protein product [Mytilus coruscus]|uniref:Uncharacterized protein n=1 Tax=Mytilus coruscus TaxID=42192 RepID=A0A6J8BRE3_MYTCO|nr:unnamed protein product [Mytilus coruscus]
MRDPIDARADLSDKETVNDEISITEDFSNMYHVRSQGGLRESEWTKDYTRQSRNSHQNEHYCAALYKYIWQYAIKYKDNMTLLCINDKSKDDFGEPGFALAYEVRGRQSIVPVDSSLSALDHDFCWRQSDTICLSLRAKFPHLLRNRLTEGLLQFETKISFSSQAIHDDMPTRWNK